MILPKLDIGASPVRCDGVRTHRSFFCVISECDCRCSSIYDEMHSGAVACKISGDEVIRSFDDDFGSADVLHVIQLDGIQKFFDDDWRE